MAVAITHFQEIHTSTYLLHKRFKGCGLVKDQVKKLSRNERKSIRSANKKGHMVDKTEDPIRRLLLYLYLAYGLFYIFFVY